MAVTALSISILVVFRRNALDLRLALPSTLQDPMLHGTTMRLSTVAVNHTQRLSLPRKASRHANNGEDASQQRKIQPHPWKETKVRTVCENRDKLALT